MGALSHLVTLTSGIYTGIYLAQNYKTTKVDYYTFVNDTVDKIKKYLEDMVKPKP